MIGYMEAGERSLTVKWLRKIAQALDTTPGLLLDCDPSVVDSDVVVLLSRANSLQRRQLGDIARALLRESSEG